MAAFRFGKKEKDAAEKIKMQELQDSIKSDSNSQTTIETMKAMNVSEEVVQKIQQKLEDEAKLKVSTVQGQYYETFD